MSHDQTVLVFFNTDQLGANRFQVESRERLLAERMAFLRQEMPAIRLLAPNVASCAVTAVVDSDGIADFLEYLDRNSSWVTYEFDAPGLLKAAKHSRA